MRTSIDLSCDLGEAPDDAGRAAEASLWPLITSANVACGGHTGDAVSMRAAARLAREHSVDLGAHPSYPDRAGFGRRTMAIERDALIESLVRQIGDLQEAAAVEGLPVTHVKPHGALYNNAYADERVADGIVEAARRSGATALVCSSRSAIARAAERRSLRVIAEAFGDRRYRSDGSLVPRSSPRSLLLDLDEAAQQAVSITVDGRVESETGEWIDVEAETLCIHSDMERAVDRLVRIRERLATAGVAFASPRGR
jgi:5-oxoprolinase (ATP-hydrolysing) subunit A